jgi:hypothetical protein
MGLVAKMRAAAATSLLEWCRNHVSPHPDISCLNLQSEERLDDAAANELSAAADPCECASDTDLFKQLRLRGGPAHLPETELVRVMTMRDFYMFCLSPNHTERRRTKDEMLELVKREPGVSTEIRGRKPVVFAAAWSDVDVHRRNSSDALRMALGILEDTEPAHDEWTDTLVLLRYRRAGALADLSLHVPTVVDAGFRAIFCPSEPTAATGHTRNLQNDEMDVREVVHVPFSGRHLHEVLIMPDTVTSQPPDGWVQARRERQARVGHVRSVS